MSKIRCILISLLAVSLLSYTGCNSSNRTDGASSSENGAGLNSEAVKNSIYCMYDIFDVCAGDNNEFYIADKDTIRVYDNKWREKGQISEGLKFCTAICLGGGNIYAYDKDSGDIRVYDMKGKLIKTLIIDDIGNIKKFIYTNGKLVFYKPYDNSLTIYDIAADNAYKANLGNIAGISTYKGSSILVYMTSSDNIDKYFIAYNVGSNEISSSYNIDRNIGDLTYSKSDDSIYYFSGGNAYKSKLNGSVEPVLMSNNNNFRFIAVDDKSCFMIDPKNRISYEAGKDALAFDFEGVEKVDRISDVHTDLNIITSYESMEKQPEIIRVMQVFCQEYPFVNVSFEYSNPAPKGYPDGEYDMAIKTRLMAQDEAIDILLFNSDAQEATILNAGYLLDLSGYAPIMAEYEHVFEGIRKLCTFKGKLIGVPYSVFFEAWSVDDGLLEKINMECPKAGWTWDDFYIFAKEVRRDSDGDGLVDTVAFGFKSTVIDPLRTSNYCHSLYMDLGSGKAFYNSMEFIGFLNTLKKIMEEGLLTVDGQLLSQKKIYTVFQLYRPEITDGDIHLIAPPTVQGSFKTPVKINMFCINGNSTDKDIAAEYLRLFMSYKLRLKSELYPPSYYKSLDYYEGINFIPMRGKQFSSEENFRLFEYMINNSAIQLRNRDYTTYYGNILGKFSAGEINAEEAAKLINIKAEMVLGE